MRFFLFLLSGLALFCLPVDPIYPQQDSLKENILIIKSEPEGASVFIDSLYVGVTPLEMKNIKNGKYVATLRMDGFNDKSYFIEMVGGTVEKYAIMSGDYALININSEPPEADFYLNDVYIGKTPISDFRIPLGILKIGLKKNFYKETDIFINAISYKYKIAKNLEPNYGVFHFNNINNHSFYIDGIKTDIIGDSFYVNKGKHLFMFEGAPLYRDIVKQIDVEAPQLYDLRFEYNNFTIKYAFVSLFIPGLGQIFDSSLKEGYGLLLGAGLTGAYIFATNNAYNQKRGKYDTQKKIYENSKNEKEAIANFNEMEKLSGDANSYKKYYYAGWTALAVIHALNLFDVFSNHMRSSDFEVYPYNTSNSTGANFKWRIR